MNKLYIVRQGQTDWNVKKLVQGKTDIELNDEGRGQAREAGELIKDKKIDLIHYHMHRFYYHMHQNTNF